MPPYRYLPNVSRHAIFSPNPKDAFGRMQTVREAIQHLRAGGALLIFPRGGIEPDPDFMPHPDANFHHWSRSLEIFLRRAPSTRILVTAVSGVISPRAMRHPMTWFRCARPDRQRLAFMYQIICLAAAKRPADVNFSDCARASLLASCSAGLTLTACWISLSRRPVAPWRAI